MPTKLGRFTAPFLTHSAVGESVVVVVGGAVVVGVVVVVVVVVVGGSVTYGTFGQAGAPFVPQTVSGGVEGVWAATVLAGSPDPQPAKIRVTSARMPAIPSRPTLKSSASPHGILRRLLKKGNIIPITETWERDQVH